MQRTLPKWHSVEGNMDIFSIFNVKDAEANTMEKQKFYFSSK